MPTGTMYLSNIQQMMMFKHEFTGQISDGMWENARPYDHYHFWYELDLAIDPTNPRIERNTFSRWAPLKKNYAIHSWAFLSIVGARTYSIALLSKFLGDDALKMNGSTLGLLEYAMVQKGRSFILDYDKVLPTLDEGVERFTRYSDDNKKYLASSSYWQSRTFVASELRDRIRTQWNDFVASTIDYTWVNTMNDIKAIRNVMGSVITYSETWKRSTL